ncbi:MAG TPA: transporter [Candidatus Acidoferrales bacterium]|nr:transporter [Candidatus Acidoferrales bacterium]
MIKNKLPLIFPLTLLGALPAAVEAQPTAHYCPGVEGLLAASAPGPGWYLRDYNVFYTADTLDDASGHSVGPANFNVFTYAQVPRLIWVTPLKFLGADVGVNALLPLVYQDVKAGPYTSSTFGVGDPLVDGFMSWHLKQFDFLAAGGVWVPMGDSSAPPTTDAGLGYWTGMLTLGGTWYMDAEKTWAISLLNRYEINSEQRDTDITPGNGYTLEWGLSKRIAKSIEVGAAGYYQRKVTTDRGPGASSDEDSVAAIGPEIDAVIPKIDWHVSLRYLYEFMAEDRAQGQTITLTLTKRF